MTKTYMFYTADGETISPIGDHIENYQILGFTEGDSVEEARKVLLKDNPWIIASGFNAEYILCREVV